MHRTALVLATVLMVLSGCGSGTGGSPGGTIIPGPSVGGTLAPAQLRLLLMDRLGPVWYCDRDEYPVGRDEQQAALDAWPEMQSEHDVFRAVAASLGINVGVEVEAEQKLAVYRLWKEALAIEIDAVDGGYRFEYLARPVGGADVGTRSSGVIRSDGEITIEQQGPAAEPICPICLARGTLIDTPAGTVPVERLRLGDPIWTLTAEGSRVAGIVIALGSTAAPRDHEVVRLVLEDGRTLTVSPGHPLADARLIGDLRPGDAVDGSLVATAERVSYESNATYDLVASGETGAYFGGGIRLGSTLAST